VEVKKKREEVEVEEEEQRSRRDHVKATQEEGAGRQTIVTWHDNTVDAGRR